MTTEFPGNSRRPRPQEAEPADEKKIEQVTTSPVESRKKPLLKRFMSIFIGGDSKSVASYVLMDVLVPQAKEMLAEATSQGIERMIYGESRPGHRRGYSARAGGGPSTPYNRYAVRGNNPLGRAGADDRRPVAEPRSQDVDDLLFATHLEAETTLERMYDLFRDYETVSVADLNSLIGRSSSYTDQKWGWTSLQGSRVFRNTGGRNRGYILELPRIVAID
jgi:hypothetical protein